MKGQFRILHEGVTFDQHRMKREYDANRKVIESHYIETHQSNPKIDKLRKQTLEKVMKKLSKNKKIIITSILEDERYTTICYEVI